MEFEILHTCLQLDSIYRVFTWDERMRIHLYMMNRFISSTSKISAVYEWVEKTGWDAPIMKHMKDNAPEDVFYNEKNSWRKLERYPANHPETTKQLKNFICKHKI